MIPSVGSLAITRSATAARNTERMITNLVLIVVAASSVLRSFTHASTCDRRIAFKGTSEKGTVPAA